MKLRNNNRNYIKFFPISTLFFFITTNRLHMLADNPVFKLLCSLVKLLTLDLVVTCLQGSEHYTLLPMLKIRVHQIFDEVHLRA